MSAVQESSSDFSAGIFSAVQDLNSFIHLRSKVGQPAAMRSNYSRNSNNSREALEVSQQSQIWQRKTLSEPASQSCQNTTEPAVHA